jgi:hypothetical protein
MTTEVGMLIFAAFIQDDGLTFREVISGIPHDAGAILAFILIAVFVGAIWLGSRSTGAPQLAPPDSQPQDPAPAGTKNDPARRPGGKAGNRHHRR